MTQSDSKSQARESASEPRDRTFAMSANRGKASHRVRYVEAGGAAVDSEECTFCQAVPDLSAECEMPQDEQ